MTRLYQDDDHLKVAARVQEFSRIIRNHPLGSMNVHTTAEQGILLDRLTNDASYKAEPSYILLCASK